MIVRTRMTGFWKYVGALTLFAIPALLRSQSAKPVPETLNNKTVIEMVTAKLPTALILARVDVLAGEYDVSTSGLLELSKAKVPTEVVKAMMQSEAASARTPSKPAPVSSASAAPPPPPVAVRATSTSPAPVAIPARAATPPAVAAAAAKPVVRAADAEFPTEPGIYLQRDSLGGKAYTLIEPSAYTQGKTGGFLKSALTYGIAKVTVKAVLRGATANTRADTRDPVFYFLFEKTNAGLSNGGGFFGNGATSPNEFTLIQLQVEDNSRETTVMSANAFGTQSGTSDKSVVPYSYERLRPGVYRVTVKGSMNAGEYCFISATGAGGMGAAAARRLWDFAVR